MERVKGIEPSSQAWEAHILPLNHTRTGKTDNERVIAVDRGRNGGVGGTVGLPPCQLMLPCLGHGTGRSIQRSGNLQFWRTGHPGLIYHSIRPTPTASTQPDRTTPTGRSPRVNSQRIRIAPNGCYRD